jgi:ribosome-associated translation inhibitor RaiA
MTPENMNVERLVSWFHTDKDLQIVTLKTTNQPQAPQGETFKVLIIAAHRGRHVIAKETGAQFSEALFKALKTIATKTGKTSKLS